MDIIYFWTIFILLWILIITLTLMIVVEDRKNAIYVVMGIVLTTLIMNSVNEKLNFILR